MKKGISKFISVMAIVLSLCFALSACSCNGKPDTGNGSSDGGSSSDGGNKTTISFSCGDSLVLDEWTTQRLTATASDNSSVTLKADDASMLYIRGSNVTAIKAGSTTITATAGKKKDVTAKINVTVNAKPENRPVLSINGSSDIALGKTVKYGVTLSGVEAADYVVNYDTANHDIATVDAEGNVTAVASGKTKLTASTTYRSVEFKAEKDIIVSKLVRVVFDEGQTEAKLAVADIKEDISGDYEVEIDGKKYTVDGEGEITLNKADFDLETSNTYDGKIISGNSVYEFKVVIYSLTAPSVYQNGVALKPDENGEIAVDKTQAADENGLRWLTFDDANTMLDMGYELLKVTVKFNEFCGITAGVVDSTIAAYHYNFGYKYTEYTDDPETGDLVWFFWDNDYQSQAYGGAMKPAHHAPYGYGYIKILDKEGNLLLDYYQKQITDASGTHGNWSDYIDPLKKDTEYTLLFDISKTHDISLSGFDDAVITNIEWSKKEATTVAFEQESIAVDEWVETEVKAKTNDGSSVTYTVSDPDVLYISGNTIVGLKSGEAKVIATANGATAELTVTVNEKAENRPVVDFSDIELTELDTYTLAAQLKSGEAVIDAKGYVVTYEVNDDTIASIAKNVLSGLKAGETTVTVRFVYCGKEFSKEVNVAVKKAAQPVDPSKGKLYQGGAELVADDNGNYALDASKEDLTLTFDPYATKSNFGYTKIRFTAKFSEFANDHTSIPYVPTKYSFGYTYGNVGVGWFNSYVNGSGKKEGAYAGAFKQGDDSPKAKAYLRVYNAKGEKIFEHYEQEGWSSTAGNQGYIPELEANVEYTFEIDVEKTGDVTLYGFDKATFTKIQWVKFDKTEVTFDQESITEDEWVEFEFSAISNDGSDITITSDNEEVLLVKGNKAIGIKAGTANIVATANGVTAQLPVTINANEDNAPAIEASDLEMEEGDFEDLSVTFSVGGNVLEAGEYTVAYATESDGISISGNTLTAVKAGEATVTVTVTYWGKTFTETITVTVAAAEEPVDNSKGKLYQNGVEITAGEDGSFTPDKAAEVKTLTFDSYATKSAFGMRRVRFTVKFTAFSSNVLKDGYEFGYIYNNVYVTFDNDYSAGMYAGAFLNGTGDPTQYGYVRIYDSEGNKYFEHYQFAGWSSSDGAGGYGYVKGLALNTEYTFDIDVEKTGDITLYGFENAVFTKIEWVDYTKTVITFSEESATADEWEWFGFSATTNDLSTLTFSSDNEEVLIVKGNQAMGLKAGAANIVAKNSAGATVKLPVTINEKEENRPSFVLNNTQTELNVYDYIEIDYTFSANGEDIASSNYTVAVTVDDEEKAAVNGLLVAALKAGEVKVTVTVNYSGVEFKKELTLTVNQPEEEVNPAQGKLYNDGKELTAENGQYVANAANTKLTFDKAAYKAALGYGKVRFTVKFTAFASNVLKSGYEFGFTYKNIQVLFDNDYSLGMYAGAFVTGSGSPTEYGYVRIYDSEGNKYFEHYQVGDWSSSKNGCGYVAGLAKDTEYTFEVDIAKTGDITLYGFETATFTKIEWVA